MKNGKVDLDKATEAMAIYGGALSGANASEEFEKKLKSDVSVLNTMKQFYGQEVAYDKNKADLEAKQKESEYANKLSMGTIIDQSIKGKWDENQWNDYLNTPERVAALNEFIANGNSLTVAEKNKLSKIYEAADKRVKDNLQAHSVHYTAINGITPAQTVSNFTNTHN